MRYLRLYKNDTDFKTHEGEAGGTGINVESVVPGIVKTLDERKMYFNPHDKEIRFHTLTINYKKRSGESLAPSSTKSIKYIPGVEQEIVVTPDNIEGYVPKENKKTVIIPTDSVVDFIYGGDPKKPLAFNIISSGTIYWKTSDYYHRETIQYKKNNENWTDITSSTGGTSISVDAGDVVQFRGDNATYGNIFYYNSFSGSTNTKFEAEGNIMSLINSTGFTTATTLAYSYTFYNLFHNCTGLTSVEKLVLPATTLAKYCYYCIFNGCTSLTTAPELPATTLESYCYYNMFWGCTSLTTAPALPATTLTEGCYQAMFQDCTSLIQAPELPATTLVKRCYRSMFYNCSSLTTAPELPATTLANNCYASMFYNCTSLTTAPALPATTLADYCYSSMFYNCTSLATAPELPATTLESYCYYNMFHGCTSLTIAPELSVTALTTDCYHSMFYGCTSLATAPELPATSLPSGCYNSMFRDCRSLNYIKCLATSITVSDSTENWVNGVASSGTFVKSPNMSSWRTGSNGIPNGWTVQDAS